MEKVLGKITKAEFGYGGYQDCQFGLELVFCGNSASCGTFINYGDGNKIQKLLKDAKVLSISQLNNKPVEIVFDHGVLDSYRILTEVL